MAASTFRTQDDNLVLNAAGLIASSAVASVAYIDLGASTPTKLDIVINVTALEIASNDEAYTIVAQASPDTAFTAAGIVELAHLHLGAKETKLSTCDQDDATGVYTLTVSNTHAGTTYRYLRLYTVVAGTIATGINYSAYAAPLSVVDF